MENRNDILNELREISPVIASMEKVNTYAVPAGYFDTLAGDILLMAKVENGGLLADLKQQPGSVPAGYFDTLADTILGKIKAQENEEHYPVLDKISKQNIYTVPKGYFETSADIILSKLQENEEHYPVLDTISKQNVYTVPNGYFETLSDTITVKANQPQAKVVSMGKRNSWMKYAAAAVFTGVIMFGTFKFMNKSKTEQLPDYITMGQKINNVDEAIATAAEDDVIKYLQKEGTDLDANLVAGTIDEKELPSQEDYLLDEKTLDNFLDNIDLKEKDLNN